MAPWPPLRSAGGTSSRRWLPASPRSHAVRHVPLPGPKPDLSLMVHSCSQKLRRGLRQRRSLSCSTVLPLSKRAGALGAALAMPFFNWSDCQAEEIARALYRTCLRCACHSRSRFSAAPPFACVSCPGRVRRGLAVRRSRGCAAAGDGPEKRIVITGMGLVSCSGNDIDVFYDKLLAGVSGVDYIDRFRRGRVPNRIAAQIKNFDNEGLIDGKNDRRLDDCLRYALVSGKKALMHANLGDEELAKVSWLVPTPRYNNGTPLCCPPFR